MSDREGAALADGAADDAADDALGALRTAVEATDWPAVTNAVRRGWFTLVTDENSETTRALLERVPASVLRAEPLIATELGIVLNKLRFHAAVAPLRVPPRPSCPANPVPTLPRRFPPAIWGPVMKPLSSMSRIAWSRVFAAAKMSSMVIFDGVSHRLDCHPRFRPGVFFNASSRSRSSK